MFGEIRLWGYNERRKWYKRAEKRYKKGIIVGGKGRERKKEEAIGHPKLPSPKGANVNNRWWNDRREWNLRITDTLSCRPRRGRTGARQGVVRPLWGRLLPP